MAKEKEKDKKKEKDINSGNGEDKEVKDEFIGEEAEDTGKSEEELIKELQEEIDKLTTKDIITQMMISLSSFAYKKMGIPVGVNDKYKDKEQAKLAIDGFDALLEVIMDEVSAEERENLKSSLANLQINFIKVFK